MDYPFKDGVRKWLQEQKYQYKKNAYRCEGETSHTTITIDRDKGVTPFMTKCPVCEATTVSSMYRVAQSMEPTHEWFRPPADKWHTYKAHTQLHLSIGGLILEEIKVR